MEQKNLWTIYTKEQIDQVHALGDEYRAFLDEGKTERECIDYILKEIKKEGYKNIEDVIKEKKRLQCGDKVYAICMKKSIVLFQIGENPLEEGMNILGAHIDSPRLDIKQNPLYEEGGFAYLDTHYYGGVKKFHWVALPLALHGVVVKKDGTVININIGEKENDPVFFISDLLIHLSAEQLEKKAGKVIEGEALDLVIGNMPGVDEDEKESVKKNILNILKEQYDFCEEDFLSAELEVVPAGKAREAGFDRSMILGYGHDDRVCAFTSLKAMLEVKQTKQTTCLVLVDKEEIGSVGATGMQSRFFENTVAEVMNLLGEYSDILVRRCLTNSCMLSSDVSAAFDPNFASCFDKKNTAFMGCGIVFNKFTGARGKSGSNDANAEYMAHLRNILEQEDIKYQTAELGKVDLGGGGTIAYMLAKYGMNVIDCGVAVMSMHAPWEVINKADLLEIKRGYEVFLKEANM
ncbi:MAG: aminopeptidase [Lachnospiraceae bacterium]